MVFISMAMYHRTLNAPTLGTCKSWPFSSVVMGAGILV